MGWFEDVTGTSSEQRETYRSNKEALGGRTINQANLNEAANIGALGRNSSGETVRDPSAYERAERAQSGSGGNGGRITPADKRQSGTYLDMILNQAFGAPPVPMPAGMRPGVAPTPMPRPAWYGNAATIQEMQTVQRGIDQGMSLEDIMGGVLGAGAAVLAYEMWKSRNAGSPSAFTPNGGDFGPSPNMGPMGPNPAGGGSGGVPTSTRPRIVDGVPFETDIIDATFEELYNAGQLGYEPRLQTNPNTGVTSEVKMLPTYNMQDDGIGYNGGNKEPLRLPPPSPARMEPAVTGSGEPSTGSSINSTIIEPHSSQYYKQFADDLKTMGITEPGQLGITPSNAPQLWEGLTKAMQGL